MSINALAAISTTKPTDPQDAKLRKSCQQFEGQFFALMLQEMRKTVPQDPELRDDANQQDIFQGMMDDNMAQQMALHGGANDLASQMYKQLSHELQNKHQGQVPVPVSGSTASTTAVKRYAKATEDGKR